MSSVYGVIVYEGGSFPHGGSSTSLVLIKTKEK